MSARTNRPSVGSGALSLVLISSGLFLAGCASGTEEAQTLSVTFVAQNADAARETQVAVPAITCTSIGDARTFGAASSPAEGPSPVAGVVNEEVGSHSLLLQIDETLWFSANEPYTVDGDRFVFDDLPGMVSLMGRDGIPADAIDMDATLNGTLECSG